MYKAQIPCLAVLLTKFDDRYVLMIDLASQFSLQRKNAFNRFIEALLKENKCCKKRHFNKNLVMSVEDKRSHNSNKKCWIYNKLFAAGDNEVRDHDHVTGTF